MPDDPAPLLVRARQEARDVDEGHKRDVERVARADKARRLHRRVDVEDAGERARLVPDDTHDVPAEARETADDVLRVALRDLEEGAIVDDELDRALDVVRMRGIVGDERVELGLLALAAVRRLEVRRLLEVVLGKEGEQVARILEACLLVRAREVRDAGLRSMRRRAAELLERHLLARDRLHHVGAGDEHVRRLLDHQHEVGDRGRVDGAAGARPHDEADLWHDTRGLDVAPEDVRVAGQRDDALLDPRAAGVVDPDHRAAVLDSEVHDLADLLGEDLGERAAEDREVLGEDEDLAAEDVAVARDDRVAPRPPLAHPELDLAMPDITVELDERTGIEEALEPLAREQLALRALPLDRLLGPLVERAFAHLLETLELRPCRVLPGRHSAPIVSDLAPWPTIDRSTIWPHAHGAEGRFTYVRDAHPTGVAAEQALGELEGGHALLFASGMAAATAAAMGLLEPGKTVALAQGAYYGIRLLLEELEGWGLSVVEFDQTGAPPAGADLVWVEAPSNPFLTFPDLDAAAAHPAPVLVDATASTPVLLRALDHGADVVLHSATKYLGGHHDVLLGALIFRNEQTYDRLLRLRSRTGAVRLSRRRLPPAPQPADSRAPRTAPVGDRARDREDGSRRTEAVERVRYPGLEPDLLAARYLDGGFGGMLSFDVRGDTARGRDARSS